MVNNSHLANGNDIELKTGTAFCQGIISKYYITEDDDVQKSRNGGFGSTDK